MSNRGRPRLSESDFIRRFVEIGPTALAKQLEMNVTGIFRRRSNLEKKLGRPIVGPEHHNQTFRGEEHNGRLQANVADGIVLVGSDLHAWPGDDPPAYRAFLAFIRKLKPAVVVMNGDVIDGASISRHPPIGWEKQPKLIEELEAAQDMLNRIVLACPKATKLYWPLGNHDARFSTRLATVAPEYAKVHGVHLKDHFGERWQPCWSLWLNDDVVVKHRYKGGIHAAHNATLWAGKTTVCGHLHSLKVTPFSDYAGHRFGVDTGCLARKSGPQFGYTEDNPLNWREGFVVLTFKDGRLLWPEVCHVLSETEVEWRGDIVKV